MTRAQVRRNAGPTSAENLEIAADVTNGSKDTVIYVLVSIRAYHKVGEEVRELRINECVAESAALAYETDNGVRRLVRFADGLAPRQTQQTTLSVGLTLLDKEQEIVIRGRSGSRCDRLVELTQPATLTVALFSMPFRPK